MNTRILLVEDDERLAELTAEYLTKNDLQVSIEPRGDTAEARIVAEQPDLVILDVMLPGKDGFEVCRAVRPHYRGVILMLTARDEDFDQILGLERGDAHVIRNAGGVVTEDEIRSLAISQRLLGTTEIILIHHTDCGMLTFTDDAFKESIRAETGLRPPWAAEAFSDVDDDVRQSVARIHNSPFIPFKDSVRGFVFDVATGRLNEVHPA